ncbi:MAG: 16S rRNA (cytosine(967)-C(5))-methyltransferase RsmB [Syntrophales bacterium]|jgi:16S rRNA (cytosine967-C5)-methyltransferase|nr:16S rRNA (cytosine(967)-C(5))-methyltransferase RsmB [Syntrophales bacterium]MCK9527757.1 16S rRNA (cytosine(967)-C(5))-methyltransferase RsmB [Syntrophales bacterium]MDX9921588.1 16S rRNA (cytosine(967)-C(5))-methyltransferase RsmB [Syntrophales bacterium]
MRVFDPRRTAVDVLTRVDEDRSFLEPLLADRLSRATTAGEQDRALFTELAYGTLRLRNRLDWALEMHYRGDPAAMEGGLRTIIRVALYQLLCMDRVPDHAAVNEAVKLAKRRFPGRHGLVNALLRTIIRRRDEGRLFPAGGRDTPEFLSRYHSHPLWLVEYWIDRYGFRETRDLCEANNRTPPLTFRVNRLVTDPSGAIHSLAREGITAGRTRWSSDGLMVERRKGPSRDLESVRRGYVQAQDEASQLVSFLVGPRPGERVLDLCSGAGIKSCHLAALMNNHGAITAVDINEARLEQAGELAGLAGVTIIERIAADGREMPGPAYREQFDRILLDAPCTGLGTVRRKPEIKWFAAPGDSLDCAGLQGELLRACPAYLRPGGVLVYATCTMRSAENEKVIESFLRENNEFRLVRPPKTIDVGMIDGEGYFRTAPHRHGTDGFFGAVMVKGGSSSTFHEGFRRQNN